MATDDTLARVAVEELRQLVVAWVGDATAVYPEPDDSCPVCLAECTHEGVVVDPSQDTVETECCAAAMHRGCLSQYAASQFRTSHFAEAVEDAIAWRARGEAVHFGAVFHRLSEEGLFMPCPLCRATLLSPSSSSSASQPLTAPGSSHRTESLSPISFASALAAADLQSPRRTVSAR